MNDPKEKMIPYDVRKHTGFLRFLVIRVGVHTNQVMVNFVTAGYKPKIIKPLVDALVNKIPNIGIGIAINDRLKRASNK